MTQHNPDTVQAMSRHGPSHVQGTPGRMHGSVRGPLSHCTTFTHRASLSVDTSEEIDVPSCRTRPVSLFDVTRLTQQVAFHQLFLDLIQRNRRDAASFLFGIPVIKLEEGRICFHVHPSTMKTMSTSQLLLQYHLSGRASDMVPFFQRCDKSSTRRFLIGAVLGIP